MKFFVSVCVFFRLHTFFVANKLMGKLRKNQYRLEKKFTINTPLGKSINIDHAFNGIKVDIKVCEIIVDLIPLELHDFDVILVMD